MSDNGIPAEAHAPEGFGSVFYVPNETLEATIGPLDDFLHHLAVIFVF